MPKKVEPLSAVEVKRLTHAVSKDGEPYNALHPVGGVAGLLLQVTPTGAKSWIYRAVIGTKRRNIGLGGYPAVSLAKARDKAQECREQIQLGVDPVEQKKEARRELIKQQLATMTFKDAAEQYIKKKAKDFKNDRQREQWQSTIDNYVNPIIGKTPVREIELPHIKAVLDPIWEQVTETASRVRGRIENILGWAAVHGYRSEENPARWKGFLDKVYPSPSKLKKVKHFESISVEAMPLFMKQLKQRAGDSAKALEFLILTASRTNEVIGDKRLDKIGITWAEIDLAKKIWTVPADKMKGKKIHRVPLSDRAIDILNELPRKADDQAIFSSTDGSIPSDNYLRSVLKRMGVDATVHGFRSVFKVWCQDHTAYADEVSELALAHVNNDATRAAYARSELIDKRRLLMADWENYCYNGHPVSKTDNVTAIGGRG
jgi:integrase